MGLKENVILGHLIPAGTAFSPHLNLKSIHLAEPPQIDEPTPAPAAQRYQASIAANPPALWPPRRPETVPQAGS